MRSHLSSRIHAMWTVALVGCSGPMSLAKAIPVQAHVPAMGWRLAFPAANSDEAASRQRAIPRHRIFMVLLLRSVSRILRPAEAVGFARCQGGTPASRR